MRKLITTQLVILSSLLAAFALTLAACGGGGSSAGAGGGTTVFGSVNSGVAAVSPDQVLPTSGILVAVGYLLIEDAAAAVYQVRLVCSGGFDSTQSTDANGKFTFVGDATLSGNCDVYVGLTLVTTVAVAPGTSNEVEINANGDNFTVASVESKPGSNKFEVEVEDEKSSDQASSDSISSDKDSSESETESSDETSADRS